MQFVRLEQQQVQFCMHRFIEPSNTMISKPFLRDWGLCRFAQVLWSVDAFLTRKIWPETKNDVQFAKYDKMMTWVVQLMPSGPSFLSIFFCSMLEEVLSQHLSRRNCGHFKIGDSFQHHIYVYTVHIFVVIFHSITADSWQFKIESICCHLLY